MWPLTFRHVPLPEAVIVCLADKYAPCWKA